MELFTVSLDDLKWRTATRSSGGACVEVAPIDNLIAVRHSRNPNGAVVFYTAEEWNAFIDGAKKGEFDNLVIAV